MRNLLLLILLTSGVMWGQTDPNGVQYTFTEYDYIGGSNANFHILRVGPPCTIITRHHIDEEITFTWVGSAGDNQADFNIIHDHHRRNGSTRITADTRVRQTRTFTDFYVCN